MCTWGYVLLHTHTDMGVVLQPLKCGTASVTADLSH